MKLEDLTSPGIIPNSQKVRTEVLKSINYLAVVSTASGSTSHAGQVSAFLAAAKSEVDKYIRVPVTGVTVAGAAAVAVGATLQLTATVAPAGAQDKRVTWTSANPALVTVSATGLVRRIAAGTVVTTAASVDDPSKTGTASIT